MTKKLLMLKGLPASGKTTYANELEAAGWVRVNKDDIRKEYYPEWTPKDEKHVVYERDVRIHSALTEGHNVVVDDTNFAPKHQIRLKEIAEEYGAEFEVMFIDTPFEECIRRNKKRANSVPMEVILNMYRWHIAPLKEKKIEYDDNLDEAIICDIDGTLAHIDADNPRSPYDASRAGEDTLDDAVSTTLAMYYRHGYHVIILTGRHSGHLQVTKDWLAENGVDYDEIHSREEGDERADYIVKKELYEEHVKGKYNVKLVIDDRPQVCRMWRAEGLKVFQVGDPHHDF